MATFEDIKKEYRLLHEEFLKHNNILVKYMDNNVWAPSILKEIYKIFDKIKGNSFLDLGSGDGLAVMTASLFYIKTTGIEIEKEFHEIAQNMKNKLNIKTTLINDDMYNISFKDFDIIFIAPDKPFTLKLENKITNELKGTLIVYSTVFRPITLKLTEEIDTKHFTVGIYKVGEGL